MNTGIFIGYTILSILVFSIIYFVIKEIFNSNFKNSKLINSITSIAFGAIIFGAGILMDATFDGTYSMLSIALIQALLFGLLIDFRLTVWSVPFMLGLAFTSGAEFTPSLLGYFIAISVVTATVIVMNRVDIFKNNGTKVIFSVSLLIVSMMLSNYVYNYFGINNDGTSINIMIWVTIAYYSIVSFFQYVPFKVINEIYNHNFSLTNASSKTEEGFFKETFSVKAISSYIFENKIQMALFVTITSSNMDDVIKYAEEVEDSYYGILVTQLNENSVMCVIPTEDIDLSLSTRGNSLQMRNEEDKLYILEEIFNKISSNVNVGVCVYGVQFNEIMELIKASTITSYSEQTNPIKLYDFSNIRNDISERTIVASAFNNYSNKDWNIYESFSTKPLGYLDYNLAAETSNLELTNNQLNSIKRNFALKAIKEWSTEEKRYKLEIPYPHKALSDVFNIKTFIEKMEKYVDPEQIILGITSDIDTSDKILMKNIEELRSLGIEFAILDVENISRIKFTKLMPEYIKSKAKRTIRHPENPGNTFYNDFVEINNQLKLIG